MKKYNGLKRNMQELGTCGDDCSICPRYLATISENPEKLEEVARLWVRVGWREKVGFSEEMICNGCRAVKWCRYEDIRECAHERGLGNCGECGDYICDKINAVFKKNESYANECKKIFSEEDYDIFHRVFFSKRDKLDKIHKKIFNE
ncbi:DUF3795 domain-containing protein [Thermodesulfobacteriota bacterium]